MAGVFKKYVWLPVSVLLLTVSTVLTCLLLALLVDTLIFAALLQNVGTTYALRKKDTVTNTSDEIAVNANNSTRIDETYERAISEKKKRNLTDKPSVLNAWASKCSTGTSTEGAGRDERLFSTLDYFPRYMLCAFEKNFTSADDASVGAGETSGTTTSGTARR